MRGDGRSTIGVRLVASGLALLLPAAATAAEKCQIASFVMPITMEGTRASVPVAINGRTERFWLDTGAWFSIMSQAKADEFGLHPQSAPPGFYMTGIGGSFTPSVVNIKDFTVSGAALHKVDFIVGGSDIGNGLIGRNILAIGDAEFDLAHGVVKLIKPQHCEKTAMAYWTGNKPYFLAKLTPEGSDEKIPSFTTPVMLNNASVRADIDSGAVTLVSRAAAERAGIDLKGAGAMPVQGISGFGRKVFNGWRVRFASVSVGEETILRVALTVIDGPIATGDNAPEMLLGIDYLLAHHMYVARAQRRIYFTYTGGPAFRREPGDAQLPPVAEAATAIPQGARVVKAVDQAAAPVTAVEFSRRGAVRLAQHDVKGAIADFTDAIRLEPNTALGYRRRSEAYDQAADDKAARADFDKAVALAPQDPELLRARAWMRHGEGDDAGALADLATARRSTPAASLDGLAIISLYDELGQAHEAVAIYDSIIANHRDDSRLGQLLNGRCWSRALANVELDQALADCNRALKLNPKSVAILDSRALVFFRQQKFALARADYDAALAQAADQAWIRYMRGRSMIKLGETDRGKAECKSALESDPAIAVRVRHYLPGEQLGPP